MTLGQTRNGGEIASNVRYVLSSGIAQVGTRVRLWASAMEVTTQNALWAQKWDTDVESLLDMADEFAEEIVRAFEIELIVGEPARFLHEIADPRSIAMVYESWYHLTAGTVSGWNQSRRINEELKSEFPDSGLGHSLAGFTDWLGVGQGFAKNPEESLSSARVDVTRGIELGDESGLGTMVLAAITLAEGDADGALTQISSTRVVRPTCDLTWGVEASIRRYLGQWEEAIELVDRAMGLSPVNKPWYPTVLAASYYVGERFEQAAAVAEEVLEHQPQNIEALLVLAASQSELGLERRAHATGDLIRERYPQANIYEWLASNPYQDDRFVDRWKKALEGAGLGSETFPAQRIRGAMAEPDAANMPDGRDLLRTMGWVPLPFSCLGLVRRTGDVKGDNIWAWMILVPWSSEGKPWIDGTDIVPASTKSESEEREDLLTKMRGILDDRYGETVGNRAVDEFLAEILDEP